MPGRQEIESKERSESMEAPEAESEDRIPLLYLDVNLGSDGVSRVVIFEGDDPKEIALKFGKKHRLSDSKIEKLLKVIEDQLRNVLTQIKEKEEEEED